MDNEKAWKTWKTVGNWQPATSVTRVGIYLKGSVFVGCKQLDNIFKWTPNIIFVDIYNYIWKIFSSFNVFKVKKVEAYLFALTFSNINYNYDICVKKT